jgi:hypothetical protein
MKLSQDSSLQSSKRAPKHFRENILDHSSESFLIFVTPTELFLSGPENGLVDSNVPLGSRIKLHKKGRIWLSGRV